MLKQVEPVECDDMEASVYIGEDDDMRLVVIGDSDGDMVSLTEPEARALLEWLKRVCE
jgi:hypothetical protein